MYANHLSSVTLPESLTTIGAYALSGSAIKSINLPEGLTTIETEAFSDCVDLTNVYFYSKILADATSTKLIFDNAGEDKGGFELFVGNTVEKIPDYIFADGYIKSVTFEENSICKSIGRDLCDNSTATSITLPESLETIGPGAFWQWTKLKEIVIPNGVSSIGASAFKYCSSLTSVVIGESVTKIGRYCFENCTALTSVQFLKTDNWYVSSSGYSNGESLTSSKLAIASTAATWLRGAAYYCNYYWYREA